MKPTKKPFFGFFYYGSGRPKKRALLLYRALGVWTQSRTTWSAIGDVHDMLGVLSELGYRTDIVNYDDTSFLPKQEYDLFIGPEGTTAWRRIYEQLPRKTVSIFFST